MARSEGTGDGGGGAPANAGSNDAGNPPVQAGQSSIVDGGGKHGTTGSKTGLSKVNMATEPLSSQRVKLRNRLIEESRIEAQKHNFMTLPAERGFRVEAAKRTDRKLDLLKDESKMRMDKWEKWQKHVELEVGQRHEDAVNMIEEQGSVIVNDRVSGKYLLQETGVEGDNLKREDMDLEKEGRLFGQARDLFSKSAAFQEDLPVYGVQLETDPDLERKNILEEQVLAVKRAHLQRKNAVREYAVALEAEHTRCTKKTEEEEANLAARTERLKKQGPGMTFEARGAARRKLMEDKESFEQLQAHAAAVEIHVKTWREHIQRYGFEPNAVPAMDAIDSLTILKEADEDFMSPEEKLERRTVLAESKNQGDVRKEMKRKRKRVLPPWEKAKINEDLPEPPPLEEILDTLPPPKEGSFSSYMMKGQAMGRQDLAERVKARLDRKEAVDKAKALQTQQDLERASKKLRASTGTDNQAVSFPPIDGAEKEAEQGANKMPEVDTDMQVLQAPNTFYQMSMDDTTVIRLGGGVTVIEGLQNHQVPPLCKDWVFLRCPNSKEKCSKRHYYTSKEEKARNTAMRSDVDTRLERRVIECLTHREDLIVAIQRATKNATRKFQDHTDAFVRESDVKPLLDLLAQIRAVTVETVEAIKEWRDAARAVRLKLEHGGGVGAKERVAAAHGYSVKILVKGDLLYRGCPPYESKVKRFSRPRTLDKKADKWVLVGHFKSEFDAVTAYDKARSDQAVKHNTTVERMYERVMFLRACGHYAVESKVKHLGKLQSVCELCAVKKLEAGVEFNAPFLWNGMNYILKIPHDLDFLNGCEPLKEYLGESFPLIRNPFVTINNLNNVIESFGANPGAEAKQNERQSFGAPMAKIVKYSNGTTEWFGHLAVGTTLTVGKNKTYMPQLPFNRRQLDDFVGRNEGIEVQVLDMERVVKAARAILQEEEVAAVMGSIKDKQNDEKSAKETNSEKDSNRKDDNTPESRHDVLMAAAKSSQTGQAKGTSVDLCAGGKPVAPDGASTEASNLHKKIENVGNSSLSVDVVEEKKVETNADYPLAVYPENASDANTFFKPPPGFFVNLQEEIQLDFESNDDLDSSSGAESVDEVEAEESREKNKEKRRQKEEWDDLHERATTKMAYYSQGGVSLKVPQQRLPKKSRKPGIWVNPDEGEYKICFDGLNFTKEGMTVRGKRLQHHYYELKLKRDGEDRILLRSKVQRLLNKSVRNPDMIDVKRVIALVKFARELKGSLLLLDADKAEASVARYRGRTLAATTCQRVYRGHVARSLSMMTRHVRRLNVKLGVARELACAWTARRVVPEILRRGVMKARRTILKPVFSRTHQLDDEDVILQVYRSNHFDYKYRKVIATCYTCLKWRPRARWDLASQQMTIQHGPCTCKTRRPVERLLVRGYSPLRSLVYSVSISEKEMRRRLLLDQKRRGLPTDSMVTKACRYERLPTDYCLMQNQGIYKRSRFEPLLEYDLARRRSADAVRFANACKADMVRQTALFKEKESKWKKLVNFSNYLKALFLKAHRLLFRTQMQLQAMVHASDNAMHFVHAQLDIFADLSKAGENQSYDPIENANDHVWIKRKYESKKTLILRTLEREEARQHYFKAKYLLDVARGEMEDAKANLERATARAILAAKESTRISESGKMAKPIMVEVSTRILRMLTLRSLPSTGGRRALVFFEPEWKIDLLSLRPIPVVFGGWHLQYRSAKFLVSQPFLSYKPHRKLVIISVFEDPLGAQRKLPPFVGSIAISIYEPQTKKHLLLSFNRPDLIDALGHENNDLFEPIEEDADTQFFCPNDCCGHRLRARRRLLSLKDSEARTRPSPYSGIGIGVSGDGGPVLRCPKCSTIFRAASSIDYESMRTGKPHAGFVQRRDVFENRRRVVIERLVKLLCLNRYDKDDVVLDKFLLRKQRRVLFERLERCYWWKDMLRKRSGGKGVEIYREGRKVGGGYVVMSIFENNGDLVFEAYHPRSGLGCSLRVMFDDITASLAEEPKWANYWESSAGTNIYSVDLLRHIVDKLTFITVPNHPPPPWEGISTLQWDATGILEDIRKGHSRGLREDDDAHVKILVLRKRQRETFVIKYQDVRMVSGDRMTTTVLENSRGDMILEAHDPRSSQRHSIDCSRDRLRIILKDHPKLISERGMNMWRYMLDLIALRPDPNAGRRKMMSLRLDHLENQAEKAALQCIQTYERLEALKSELKYANAEYSRLSNVALAAEDIAEADGGVQKPMTLLRLLARNLNDANAAKTLAYESCNRLQAAVKDCEQQFYDETLERKKFLRVCTAWRREVAEQKFKSGLRLVLSDQRRLEHWKQIWYGRKHFGGHHINGVLTNAKHFIVEILLRQFGTYTDSRNICIRMRRETIYEGDQRKSMEELSLMLKEEAYRRIANGATSTMQGVIKTSMLLTDKYATRKDLIKSNTHQHAKIENKATNRLQRISALARQLGMKISLGFINEKQDDETSGNGWGVGRIIQSNRSTVAYPSVVEEESSGPVLCRSNASWEPVKATVLPENMASDEGDGYDRGQFYMYPTVFESLRYVMKEQPSPTQDVGNVRPGEGATIMAESAFGLEIRKVSELMESSGILDTMYTSVVFMLGYKFPRRGLAYNDNDNSVSLDQNSSSSVARIMVPQGVHFWGETDVHDKRNTPPEVIFAFSKFGRGKWSIRNNFLNVRNSEREFKPHARKHRKPFDISDPMSVEEQYKHEKDSRIFGKVWFRAIRNIDGISCIVTVQGVPQLGHREGSSIDISSFLRLEIYNPRLSVCHAVVIDADDLDGSAWRRHVGINQAAIKMVDKLVLRNDSKIPGKLLLGLQPSAGVIAVPVVKGHSRFCKSAALLPYCSGHGNEAYSSLNWLQKQMKASLQLPQNSVEEKPRPLFRSSRVVQDVYGSKRRMLVSLWRGQGGVRIEAYHAKDSQAWTMEISDGELATAISPDMAAVAESGVPETVNPHELGVFALREELENRIMQTHGTKQELQARLGIQLAIEHEENKRIAQEKNLNHWNSRRMLRGVSSTIGVEVGYVKSEKVTGMWDKFVRERNSVGAISAYLSGYVTDKTVYELKNAPLRQTTYEHVEDAYESLISSFENLPWDKVTAMEARSSIVNVEYFSCAQPSLNVSAESEELKFDDRVQKEQFSNAVASANATHRSSKVHLTNVRVSGLETSDTQMEAIDRDTASHEAFEHLFLEEFMDFEGKRKHILQMQRISKALEKQENDTNEFVWDLQNAKTEQQKSTNASSLDLFERDESVAIDRGIIDRDDSNESIPGRFTGVYIPVNSGQRVQRIQLTLGSWQSAVLKLLGCGNAAAERRIERIFLPQSGGVMFYRYGITRNVRASILGQNNVVGDALWMRKGDIGRACGEVLVNADAKAAERLKDLKPESWLIKEKTQELVEKPKPAEEKRIAVPEDANAKAQSKEIQGPSTESSVALRSRKLPRWRKNLAERRALRKNCMPEEFRELYQEINQLTAFPCTVRPNESERIRTEHARRTYRTSAFDQAVKIYNFQKEQIFSTKVHEFELESLLAASREGRQHHLGHRPSFERAAAIEWLLDHVALQNKPACAKKKIVVDRTLCKIVRRLPPNGRLVLLHAVRGKGKAPSQGLGRLIIFGFEPATKQQMVVIPGEDVLRAACKEVSHLLHGRDRHRNLRRVAERVINELVIMDQNGIPTLSHHKMRWVQDAIEREEQLSSLRRAADKRRRQMLAVRFALQVTCRRRRLEKYRTALEQRRRSQLQEVLNPLQYEGNNMMAEDRSAGRLRGYLTANALQLGEIRAAFELFDTDDSNEIDEGEFQDLVHSLGQIMDRKQVQAAVAKIDVDGSGQIDFSEFAMWWLTADHGQLSISGFDLGILEAHLAVKQGYRNAKKKVMMTRKSARLAGQMYAQRKRERLENQRKRREAERLRRRQAAKSKMGIKSFAELANMRVDPGQFNAKSGGADKIKHKVRWDDGIPGGIVGKVLASPYYYPRHRVRQMLSRRAEKRQKALAREEVQRKREEAAKEVAAEKLRQKLIEEELREKAEAEAEKKALKEAQQAAMRKARELREAMELQQKQKEEAELAEKKRLLEAEKAERQRKIDEERSKREELDRLEQLKSENEEQYAKELATKEAAAAAAKEAEEKRVREEKQAKQEAAAKRMEETMAKKAAEETANSASAKAEAKKKEDAEREKRQKRLQRRSQGNGKMDAAAKAQARDAKRKKRAEERASKRKGKKGKNTPNSKRKKK